MRADRCGLAKDSIILTEQIRTLDKRRLRERAGRIPEDDMRRVDEALAYPWGWKARAPTRTAVISEDRRHLPPH